MFNLKKQKVAQVQQYEKYLRENNIGPKADNSQAITDKEVPHRTGNLETTTEDQMKDIDRTASNDVQIIEKVLNTIEGKFVDHRKDLGHLTIPQINTHVEKIRQERMANEYKVEKDKHWSLTYNEDAQFGSLPEYPKNPDSGHTNSWNTDKWNKNHKDTVKIASVKGKDITASMLDRVAESIKSGLTIDYDTAIVAILKQADVEKRQLSNIEQKSISDLKVARTHYVLNSIQ